VTGASIAVRLPQREHRRQQHKVERSAHRIRSFARFHGLVSEMNLSTTADRRLGDLQRAAEGVIVELPLEIGCRLTDGATDLGGTRRQLLPGLTPGRDHPRGSGAIIVSVRDERLPSPSARSALTRSISAS
jgi:hypothetical protein